MKRSYQIYATIMVLLVIAACSKMDDYKDQFLKGYEIQYPSKIDSVIVKAGINRVQMIYTQPPGDRINKLVVYWAAKADSAVFQLEPVEETEFKEVMIENLAEGIYSFEIYTYDDAGNRSVPKYATGRVIGDDYISTLKSRGVTGTDPDDNGHSMWVNWAAPVSGVAEREFMELTYPTNSGYDTTIVLPATQVNHKLLNFKRAATSFSQRSIFVPGDDELDTLYSLSVVHYVRADITYQHMQNYKQPFTFSEWDGNRWGTLDGWIINDAAKNKSGYGGFDNEGGSASLGFEKWGDGDAPIVNGKAYQVVTLEPGNYTFVWTTSFNPAGFNHGDAPRYLVVAEGNGIPDIEELEGNTVVHRSFTWEGTVIMPFTLKETKTLSLGMVFSFTNEYNGFRANQVQLNRVP